jgi:hypothetical protein
LALSGISMQSQLVSPVRLTLAEQLAAKQLMSVTQPTSTSAPPLSLQEQLLQKRVLKSVPSPGIFV